MALFRPAAKDRPRFSIDENDPWWEPPALRAAPEPDELAAIDLRPSRPAGRQWLTRGPIAPAVSHLLLLRAFLAFGWLRAAADKLGDGHWWDGAAVTDFLSGGAAHAPIAGFSAFADTVLLPFPAVVAVAVVMLELVIGLAILTGIRFDAALGLGIGLCVVFLAAGQINPAAFYIIIQLALLGSPAGRTWVIEPWNQPSFLRWAPWAAGAAGLAMLWSVFAAGSISTGSVADPAAVLGFLGLFAVATLTVLWLHDRRGVTA